MKFKNMMQPLPQRTFDTSASQAEFDLSTKIREVANKATNHCEAELELSQDQGDLIYHLVLDALRYIKNYPREQF